MKSSLIKEFNPEQNRNKYRIKKIRKMTHHPQTPTDLKSFPPPSRATPSFKPDGIKAASKDITVTKEKHLQQAADAAHWVCLGPTKEHVHWERLVILVDPSGTELFFLQKTSSSCTSGNGAWKKRAGDLLNDEYYTSPSGKGKFFEKCSVSKIVDKNWYLRLSSKFQKQVVQLHPKQAAEGRKKK